MHELESFLHLLQRLSYFDQTFLYADEVRDFHAAHHLQSPLVRVESLKSITEDAHHKDTDTVCGQEEKKKRGSGQMDGRHQTGVQKELDVKKKESIGGQH